MHKTRPYTLTRSRADYLHLFVLVGFALAQPLYEMLGRSPEFFTVHRAEPVQIVSVILLLSAGTGLLLSLIEFSSQMLGQRVRRVVHNSLVTLLLALIVALPAKRWIVDNDLLFIAAVAGTAMVFTVAYARFELPRLFLTTVSPAILFFPLWFVFATPVAGLVFPKMLGGKIDIEIANPVPVVVVVFDEFSLASLLDSEELIDTQRFPNFATFTSESFWFRNAIAVSQSTEEAVPSILTGKYPSHEKKLLPTLNDHPANLFTMLTEDYSSNVLEAVTSLYDHKDEATQQAAPMLSDILYDIAVAYLHMVLPPQTSAQLPQLDDRWTGFREAPGSNEGESAASDNGHKQTEKAERLDLFLSGIKAGNTPQLHFLHTLLPHTPHQFLPSGQRYTLSTALPDGLLGNIVGWADTEPLIITAYHRNLQQLGFVDSFVGKLRKKLLAEGLYDEALIIITADHGVAYRNGHSRRHVKKVNVNEILNIPLFIKLPNQSSGQISEQTVTSADILPTIIDVLEADVPWDLDGQSVFSKQRPPLRGHHVPRAEYYDMKTILDRKQLAWQIAHFGEHTPLQRLIQTGPAPQLAGRKIDDLDIGPTVDMALKSRDIMNFENIDTSGDLLPLLFRGTIEGADTQALPIAIAVNGTIWATTFTTQWREQNQYFSILLPPDALTSGRNALKAYLIDHSANGPMLRPFMGGRLELALKQNKDQLDTLVFPDNKEIVIETARGDMNGYSDRITLEGDVLNFRGWAVDLIANQPASNVLLFKGGQLVWQATPSGKRTGVGKKYGSQNLLYSGYSIKVPLSVLSLDTGVYSLVALSGGERAFRLKMDAAQMQVLLESVPQQ